MASLLEELYRAIEVGSLNSVKELFSLLVTRFGSVQMATPAHSWKKTDIIIKCCKFNQLEILDYFLDEFQRDDAYFNAPYCDPPYSKDADGHSAIYYAVRTSNLRLVECLFAKWLSKFGLSSSQKDEIISEPLEELKLKNVPVARDVEFFLVRTIVEGRFYSDPSPPSTPKTVDVSGTINFFVEHVKYLQIERSQQRFLLIGKYLAICLNVLKTHLKWTYAFLPWEEIEFCLITYISANVNIEQHHLYFLTIPDKAAIIIHLTNFSYKLKTVVQDINLGGVTNKHPKQSRDEVVSAVKKTSPEFVNLYAAYDRVRDVYSLEKIDTYSKMAIACNVNAKIGKLLIIRALQVIGEHVKNTLVTPKMSSTTSKILLGSLPKNTRALVTCLRDSLSHADSLVKRWNVETGSVKFFSEIQNDMKKIHRIISEILTSKKIAIVRTVLETIVNNEDHDEISNVVWRFENMPVNDKYTAVQIDEYSKLKKLVKKLDELIPNQTYYQKHLLTMLRNMVSNQKSSPYHRSNSVDQMLQTSALKAIRMREWGRRNHSSGPVRNDLIIIKSYLNLEIQKHKPENEFLTFRAIYRTAGKLIESAKLRNFDGEENVLKILKTIQQTGPTLIHNLKAMEETTNLLSFKRKPKISSDKFIEILKVKLQDLKSVLDNESNMSKITDSVLGAIEILVLDILSILEESENRLENSFEYLYDCVPLLLGKSLRNHIAHYNALLDILPIKQQTMVLANALKISREDLIKEKSRIGGIHNTDLTHLRAKLRKELTMLSVQEEMFLVYTEGDSQHLLSLITRGADLHGRSGDLETSLHYAARGPSHSVIELLLKERITYDAVDKKGRNALHHAAVSGVPSVVELLSQNLDVDQPDRLGRTALHLAAGYGKLRNFEALVASKADMTPRDYMLHTPVDYAIYNDHVHIVKFYAEKSRIALDSALSSLSSAAEAGSDDVFEYLCRNKAASDMAQALAVATRHGRLGIFKMIITKGVDINKPLSNGLSPLFNSVSNGNVDLVKWLLDNTDNAEMAVEAGIRKLLFVAILRGFSEITEILLAKLTNVNINLNSSRGNTLMHVAATTGDVKTISLLIERGGDIDAINDWNQTPIILASAFGNAEALALLIDKEANVNAKDINGFTSLHNAIFGQHSAVAQILVRHGTLVNEPTLDGQTPLHLVSAEGDNTLTNFLIKYGADVNAKTNTGRTPLHEAVAMGEEEVTKSLVGLSDVNASTSCGELPLVLAAASGSLGCVKLLIENGVAVNQPMSGSHNMAILAAVGSGHGRIVDLLLRNGADLSTSYSAYLRSDIVTFAVMSGLRDVVKVLLKYNVSANSSCMGATSPLHVAVGSGYRVIASDLIARGALVNALTAEGVTPLHMAVAQNDLDMVALLLSKGADPDAVSNNGDTPLILTARKGNKNMLMHLLKYDVNLSGNIKNILQEAIINGNLDIVKFLFVHKYVDKTVQFEMECNALHIAATTNYLDIIKFLVAANCDLESKNGFQMKPIHIAAMKGDVRIVKYFLQHEKNMTEADRYFLMRNAATQSDVTAYFIENGFEVNSKKIKGVTPLQLACNFGCTRVVRILLENGAIYDVSGEEKLEIAKNADITSLFTDLDKLFKSIKENNPTEVKDLLATLGACSNAKNTKGGTPLHLACWLGHYEIVKILLQHGVNPNALGEKSCTPLHYAVKYSSLEITEELLAYGAMYNACTALCKTPADITRKEEIKNLLSVIDQCFGLIERNDEAVLAILAELPGRTLRATLNSRNRDLQPLFVLAELSCFSRMRELQFMNQEELIDMYEAALKLLEEKEYEQSLKLFETLHGKISNILGNVEVIASNVQMKMCFLLSKLRKCDDSLNLARDVLAKQQRIVGSAHEKTLQTKGVIASIFLDQGKNREALDILRKVVSALRETKWPDNPILCNTQYYMALALERLTEYEEATDIYSMVYRNVSKADPKLAAKAHNNIATILAIQGNTTEALKIYQDIFENCESTDDAIIALRRICVVHTIRKHYDESTSLLHVLLRLQQKSDEPKVHDMFLTVFLMALNHHSKCLHQSSYFFFRESVNHFQQMSSVVKLILERVDLYYLLQAGDAEEIFGTLLQMGLIAAADVSDAGTVREIIEMGVNVNATDQKGRSALYFAVKRRNEELVALLLSSGANPAQFTKRGTTLLHLAAKKRCNVVAKKILDRLSPEQKREVIDAPTWDCDGTALHIAAKKGDVDVLLTLLANGAAYDSKDK